MRLIDADRLTRPEIIKMYYHLPNGDTAIPIIDIENAPTVDAVPVRHGRWEYIPGDGKFRAILICSRCRRNVGEYNRFNYCPNCGAKMDL